MEKITIAGFTFSAWAVAPVIYFIWVTVLIFVKKSLFVWIQRIAARPQLKFSNVLIKAADFPLTLLIFVSGGMVIEHLLPAVDKSELMQFFVVGFKATMIVAIVIFVDQLINGALREYTGKVPIIRSSGGVLRTIVRIVVIGLGMLMLLDSFGVSITPILASLGISSLAIALALQPTLENLFAGIQIVIDKPFSVGHFIKLESGEEGYIYRIGWRSTWIRMIPNNMVILPNHQLVNSRIMNYYYPETDMSVLIQVGVHYQSDLEHVERVTIDVARKTIKEVSGGVTQFDPFIRFHTFDNFSINFTVIFRAKEYMDHYLLKHEFIKRLHKRYAAEGITIPYPIRAINYEQERGFAEGGSAAAADGAV